MVLILGREEDTCCQLVNDELLEAGHSVWFLREDQLLPKLHWVWRLPEERTPASIAHGDRQVLSEEIEGVFCRSYGMPIRTEDYDTPDGRYICAEWNALLMAWLSQLQCNVVDRLRPELWYKSHLGPAELTSLASDSGFRLPRTLVTTDSDDARTFCREVGLPVQYSPLTYPTRYLIRSAQDVDRLDALCGSLPLQLIECIEGTARDAYVIGEAVVLVDDQGTMADTGQLVVADSCLKIAGTLELSFCRVSLVDAMDGWYCMGLDRVPQLYGCSLRTQREVAHHLIGLLTDSKSSS